MHHPSQLFEESHAASLAASSLLPLYAALIGMVKRSSCRWFLLVRQQYFRLFKDLGIKFLPSAREDFFNILACTGTSLETFVYSLTLSEFNCPVKCDFSLIFELALVSNQINANIFSSMLLDFLEPTPQIVECFITSDIIGEEYAMRTTIENSRHRFE